MLSFESIMSYADCHYAECHGAPTGAGNLEAYGLWNKGYGDNMTG
jgi:hypothetical protein